MAKRLEGSVALVTGASSGIGEATARALAAQGASVALLARRKERLDKLAKELGGRTLVVQADVTERAQVEDAVGRVAREFGVLDVVINNAGIMLLGPTIDAPVDEWERMVELNVNGFLYVAHAALPHLLKAAESGPRRVADLVGISSVAGRRARVGTAVYNATKFAVGAFSESLRQEVTKKHLRVSLIEPGLVATELQSHMRPEIREASMKNFAQLEPLQAQDIADAIEYVVTRPRHVAVNELLVRPTEQEN